MFPLPRSTEDFHNNLLWFKCLQTLWVCVYACVYSSAGACVYPYIVCAHVCVGQKTTLASVLSQVPKRWKRWNSVFADWFFFFFWLGSACWKLCWLTSKLQGSTCLYHLTSGIISTHCLSDAHRKCFTNGAISPAFKHHLQLQFLSFITIWASGKN